MSIPIIPEIASPVGERPVAGGGGVSVLAAAPPPRPAPAPSHRERGGSAGVVTQPLGRHRLQEKYLCTGRKYLYLRTSCCRDWRDWDLGTRSLSSISRPWLM